MALHNADTRKRLDTDTAALLDVVVTMDRLGPGAPVTAGTPNTATAYVTRHAIGVLREWQSVVEHLERQITDMQSDPEYAPRDATFAGRYQAAQEQADVTALAALELLDAWPRCPKAGLTNIAIGIATVARLLGAGQE